MKIKFCTIQAVNLKNFLNLHYIKRFTSKKNQSPLETHLQLDSKSDSTSSEYSEEEVQQNHTE